jgi:hypothetical protein
MQALKVGYAISLNVKKEDWRKNIACIFSYTAELKYVTSETNSVASL